MISLNVGFFSLSLSFNSQGIVSILWVLDRKINFMCEELDFSNSFLGLKSAQMSYCYFLVKICDLFDTIFFVLRKRTRQISFLHVYHHVAVMIGAYIAVAWAPGNFQSHFLQSTKCKKKCVHCFFFVFLGGQPWLFGFINCFVHVIMYSYYFGSVYSTKLKTNYFIKRSITQLQIVSHCCPFVDPFIQSKMAELIVVKNFTFFL